jgi:HSP20 family protein
MSLTPYYGNTLLNPSTDPFWNVGRTTDPFWDVGMPGMDVGFPSRMGSQLGFPSSMMGNQVGLTTPRLGIDLTEEADKWVVHADLPGFRDEDVELSIENGMLGVRGKRDKTEEYDTGISHRVERHHGEVRRAIRLPIGADQDRAQANLVNGVLTVDFPKLSAESSFGKKIPLSITGGSTAKKAGKKK